MKRPSPDNLARQDRALAYLQEHGIASTSEIAAAVWVVTAGSWEPECRRQLESGYMTWGCNKHCPKVFVPYRGQPSADNVATRAALMRLEKAGKVERVAMPESRRGWWRAISFDLDAELAQMLGQV